MRLLVSLVIFLFLFGNALKILRDGVTPMVYLSIK